MTDNILAWYPHALERLKTISGIKRVCEAGELSELISTAAKGRAIAPQDGVAYVVFDGISVAERAGNERHASLTVGMTVFLAQSYYLQGKSRIVDAGALMTAVQQSFIGWEPYTEKGYLTSRPFALRNPPPVEYNDGFALYPVSFTTTVTVTGDRKS